MNININKTEKPAVQLAHLVLPDTQSNAKKPKELNFANAFYGIWN